jgi:hypothetical protein
VRRRALDRAETMGTGYPGGTYRDLFYVGDVEASGPALDDELHVDLEEADFLAVFPLAGKGRARLIGTVRDERAELVDTPSSRTSAAGSLRISKSRLKK